jgi:osmoprotectant transport system permease protein
MVLISVGIAARLGIALGVLLTRRAALRRWVLGFAGLMQTVPSLALFGFLIPIPLIGGIGRRTAILALVLYAPCRSFATRSPAFWESIGRCVNRPSPWG